MLQRDDTRGARAVVVMAKPPRTGEVKTRLCPPFSFSQAAKFYECLLQDTLAKFEHFSLADLWISYAPDGKDYFQRIYGDRARLIPQRGGDLGRRMHHIFVDLAQAGYRRVVVVGSDIPSLPISSVEQALEDLRGDEHHLVLGPAWDGGYYLIGLKEPEARIFEGIAWSDPSVLTSTLKRSESLGLRPVLVPSAYDVDSEEDLVRLWNDFKLTPVLKSEVPRTYDFLADFYSGRRRSVVG